MLVKFVAGGIALLAAVGGFALILTQPSPAPSRVIGIRDTATLVAFLNADARETSAAHAAWTVTKGATAHRVLVLEVEARRPEDARAIATRIVRLLWWRRYYEILIYVHPADGGGEAPVRRIQWTPGDGYVERLYPAARRLERPDSLRMSRVSATRSRRLRPPGGGPEILPPARRSLTSSSS